MVDLLSYMLLSASILLSGCGRSQALKQTASDSSRDKSAALLGIARVRSASFIGADEAWLVDERDGELWRTKDGGKSWEKYSGKAVGGRFRAVAFIDSRHGWAANYEGQIWRTSDSGRSWTLISQPKGGEDNEPPFLPQQMLFVDDSHGWLTDAFAIWRTDDGGDTWTHSLSLMNEVENEIWQPTRISFINRDAGWMSATGGIVHRTKDGGKTWRSQKLIAGDSDATDVFFINERVGWLTGFVSSTEPRPGTRLYRSDDGGESWQLVPIADDHAHINSVCFINEEEGWAVGRVWEKVGDMRGLILHTTNGGKNWEEIRVGEKEPSFDRMSFVDLQHGWLFAANNIYRTQDGGKSWGSVLKVSGIKDVID